MSRGYCVVAWLSEEAAYPSAESFTREAAAQDLERRAERLRKRGLAVTTRVLVALGAGERLIELAKSLGSDLITVGTQRPRATERLLLGSMADKVVRGARQPVLVVPVRRVSPVRLLGDAARQETPSAC